MASVSGRRHLPMQLSDIAEHHEEEGSSQVLEVEVDEEATTPKPAEEGRETSTDFRSGYHSDGGRSSESSSLPRSAGSSPALLPPNCHNRRASADLSNAGTVTTDSSTSPSRVYGGSVTPGRSGTVRSSLFSSRADQKLGRSQSGVTSSGALLARLRDSTSLVSPGKAGGNSGLESDPFETTLELMRLRESNARHQGQVARLQERVESLEGEKRRMAARMSAMQTALQQKQQESDARNNTCTTAAATTMSSFFGLLGQMIFNSAHHHTKSVEGNHTPTSLPTMSMSIWSKSEIEEDHAAAISTIAKLVEENTRLVGKINSLQAAVKSQSFSPSHAPVKSRSFGDIARSQPKRISSFRSSQSPTLSPSPSAISYASPDALTASVLRNDAVQKLIASRRGKSSSPETPTSAPVSKSAATTTLTTMTTMTTTTITTTQASFSAPSPKGSIAQSASVMLAVAEASTHVSSED